MVSFMSASARFLLWSPVLIFAGTARLAAAPTFAKTQPATAVTSSNATLNGMAMVNGQASVAWFEWGPRGGYGHSSTVTAVAASNGLVRVGTAIAALTNGTAYQCRLAVSNASGVNYGATQLFTTGSRIVGWGSHAPGFITPPAGLNDAVTVSIGYQHGIALRAGGSVTAWGYDGYGQTDAPAELTNALAVAAGGNHSLALRQDGTVAAWGNNDSGQINVPAGLSNVIAIAAGWAHSVALTREGSVVAWGGYYAGSTLVPMTVPAGLGSSVTAIASGDSHVLALKADSTVAVWGDSTYGQTSLPSGQTNVVTMAGGGYHSLLLKADGTVTAWGFNNYNQTNVPYSLAGVIDIEAGIASSFAVHADGTITSWGYYNEGWMPSGLGNVSAISAGADNLALGERAPHALTATWGTSFGQDVTVTLTAEDPESDPYTCSVSRVPLKGKLYQYNPSGVRGSEILTNGTALNDAQQRVIFAPQADDFGNPYTTFDFVAGDGQLSSGAATITITMVPPAPALDLARCRLLSSGQFELNFSGQSNATYRVWRSTDLKNWQLAGTASVTSNGWFQFVNNPGQDKTPRRFFRAGAP